MFVLTISNYFFALKKMFLKVNSFSKPPVYFELWKTLANFSFDISYSNITEGWGGGEGGDLPPLKKIILIWPQVIGLTKREWQARNYSIAVFHKKCLFDHCIYTPVLQG